MNTTSTSNRRVSPYGPGSRVPLFFLLAYTLLSVYLTARVVLGLPIPTALTPAATILAFLFACLHANQRLGWKNAALLLVLTFSVALTFESVGVATGWVYGPYHYTEKLGPKFLGLVPYLIPLAWFMMSYPSFIISDHILPKRLGKVWRRLGSAALGALVMTSWDLMMDPVMVQGGHWVWEVNGGYFGIPLQNYLGWWLTILTTFGLYEWLTRGSSRSAPAPMHYDRQAVISYAVTAISTAVSGFALGLTGPTLIGLICMSVWIWLAWRKI